MTVDIVAVLIGLFVLAGITAMAEDEKPEIKVAADLELFYELSDEIGGVGDDDEFEARQLYVKFDGKFGNDYSARVVLDGADVVGRDGKTVSEDIIEEANFLVKNIGESGIDIAFGKDEQPFGQDYDKYLSDALVHNLEVDKVWGVIARAPFFRLGRIHVGTYQHRHSGADSKVGETLESSDKELGDSYAAQIKMDNLTDSLLAQVSCGSEAYSDIITTNGTTAREDESRVSVGCLYLLGNEDEVKGNINAEYTGFKNRKGMDGYDPCLVSVGGQYDVAEKITVWVRYERILEDSDIDVEKDFYGAGIIYRPSKGYQLLVEYANFNTSNLSDASDLEVADGAIEDSVKLGVKATF